MKIHLYIIILLTTLFSETKRDTLIFGAIECPTKDCLFPALLSKYLYREALTRLITPCKIVSYPPQRSLELFREGYLDGELARHKNFGQIYNKVRIEEPLMRVSVAVYSLDSTKKIECWQDIDKKYRVDCRRGLPFILMSLKKAIPSQQISELRTTEQGFERLLLNRTDMVVGEELFLDGLLTQEPFKSSDIIKNGIICYTDLYGFVAPRHQKIADRLALIFREMKDEGFFEYCRDSLSNELYPKLIE